MIIFLLFPALIYTAIFLVYATGTIYWARDPGTENHIYANNVLKWISLGFLIEQFIVLIFNRLISVGIIGFFFHGPWNILEGLSVGLNLAIIIMDHYSVDVL